MTITYFGLTCLRIQNGGVSLLFDPPDSATGLKLPRMQNDIILYSQKPFGKIKKDGSFIITSPGEYEVKGVFIYGTSANGEEGAGPKIIYLIEHEDIRLAFLGTINQAKITESQLERLEGVDILMVPVGGGHSLTAKQAAEIISQLEPRLVVPINYQLAQAKLRLDSLDKFKREIGAKFEAVDKLKISRKDLPEEETRFVVIEPVK